ncbi:dicarboxylate/amino acid:cation symporter [Proteiniclasticum ruminis]|uniref:Na+/H+-dicarboxylate symporter n=2 Tax=Proteiniclasticum ruminis TaxID=398199 RepID=A0A1G8HRR0_9CLOT|nr:dicarboxylate/amino acid:cation symporter [Proteiniclasticum ruminis]SDI09348.1 Na+/H+-dicarboxylate symporter [Proteiniclasticum ruminis]
MGILKSWNKISLFTRIMIGFVLGIVAGLILREKASMFSFLGTILTRMLTMVVAPLVLCVIVNAVANMGDGKRLGRIGLKTITVFLVTTLFAIFIGLVIANVMNIGSGVTITPSAPVAEAAKEVTFVDTLVNIIPSNIFLSLSNNELLQIIFFSIILGLALLKLGKKSEPLLNLFAAGQEAMQKVTSIILEYTPIGVFGLMANVIGSNGLDILIPYSKAIIALYISSIFYLVFVQAGLVAGFFGKISPKKFLATMKEPMAFVFASCSSVATIPLTLESTKKLGVDDDTANFVIPLGAVVNMNGTAIYQAVAVIFTAQIFGINLSIMDQIMVMFTATLAAIGTAGIPGSGLIMLTIVLGAANLPMEGVALLAGIDRILNMGRVVPNIVGDAAAAVVVARSEKTLRDTEDILEQVS